MRTIEPRPCPFCGHNDIGVETDPYWRSRSYLPYLYAVCVTCGAQGPIVRRYDLTEKECADNAMEAWNRRFTV